MVHINADNDVELSVHDSTQEFPGTVKPNIVVCNPPWGWRLKAKQHRKDQQDSSAGDVTGSILQSLLRQFPSAVHVFVCPEIPSDISEAGFRIHHRCPLGQSAIWILCRCQELT